MHAVVWSDYLCPWCYLGLDRTALLADLGVTVTPLPYELHPEIPPGGWPLSERRGRRVYDRLAAACEAAGLEFARPAVIPNTRRAHETASWVRLHEPAALPALHRSLFRAVFVDGGDVADPAVLNELVAAAGADAEAARAAVDAGALAAEVERSREAALEAGAAGAPAWLIDDRLLIAGVQPRETFERLVTRLGTNRSGPRSGA